MDLKLPDKKTFLTALVKLTLLAGLSSLLGFFYSYHLPKLESWLLLEVERISEKRLPMRIWPTEVEMTFFPPGVRFKKIRTLPKPPLNKTLAPMKIESVTISVSIFSLIKGELRASEIEIHRPEIVFIQPKPKAGDDSSSKKKFSLPEFNWPKWLRRIPVDAVVLSEANVFTKSSQQDTAMRFQNADLILENKFQTLSLKLIAPEIDIKPLSGESMINLSLNLQAVIEPDQIQLTGLKLQSNRNFMVSSGVLSGDFVKFRLDGEQINYRGYFDLAGARNLVEVFTGPLKYPELSGYLELEGDLSHTMKTADWTGKTKVSTKKVRFGKFKIGQVKVAGTFEPKRIKIDSLNVNNRELKASLSKGLIRLKDKSSEFSFRSDITKVDFKSFMASIGLPEIPVEAKLSGKTICGGQLQPEFRMKCRKTTVQSQGLHVYTKNEAPGKSQKTIVRAPKLSAKGQFEIDKEKVTYRAQLQGGKNSKGSSKGQVSFEKGFDISFKASRLDLNDIENLADLQMEGNAVLSGRTFGTSKKGQVTLDVRARDFWLENFGLGQLKSKVRYRSGKLSFSKAEGQFKDSQYKGNVVIDLKKDKIYITSEIPYLELEDLKNILSRRYPIPTEARGSGSGLLRAWGPLDLKRLSYEVDSSFFRGEIANENFDEAIFNVRSKRGQVNFQNVSLQRGESQIVLSGGFNPTGKMDASAEASNFRLEQLDNLERLGLDVTGRLDATMKFKGQIPDLEMILKGKIENMILAGQPAKDSKFEIDFFRTRLKGRGQLLGNQIETSFSIPYQSDREFDFQLSTKNLDFTRIFSLASETAQEKDFRSRLDTKIDLQSSSGGFWNSSGTIRIDEFSIQQGGESLKNSSPLMISMNNGVFNTEGFQVAGENSFLKVSLKDATQQNFKASLDAKFGLNLISLLTPFLPNLQGRLTASVQSDGPISDINLIGSAFVDKGLVKFAGFPHPLENVSTDILFNHRDIMINALKAELGGGTLRAQGKVMLESMTEIPVAIRGNVNNIALNVPSGIKTKGSGPITFQGTKFPYTLAATYNVNYADVSMEFGGSEQEQSSKVQPSQYLPDSVTDDVINPLLLDLQINLTRPAQVNNSLVKAEVNGQLKVEGSPPENLKMNGILKPQPGGTLFFRDTEFLIRNSYVEYDDTLPTTPKIYLDAEATVTETAITPNQQRINTNYEVGLLVQGRAPDFNISLDSQPPLSEQQIVSLLALGVTSASQAVDDDRLRGDGQAGGLAPGVIGTSIGAQLIGKQLGEPLKDRLGVDMTISTSVNADDNASYPRVILSKQWSPKWETSASRTIEANPRSDVRLQYRMNNNLSFIGLWEGRENSVEQQFIQQNQFGVDVEFRQSFK